MLWFLPCAAPFDAEAAVRYAKQVAGRHVLIVVPDRHAGAIPLVVALHGCDQSPEEFLESTGLDRLVDERSVALVLPQSPATGDNPLGCWRWWDPENQRRNGRDTRFVAAAIKSMDVEIDRRRIYALGLSAGGAMAMILSTVYADVFAAVGIHSGVGFAAAANTACALKVLERAPADAEQRGQLGYHHQSHHRIVPTMIIHGRDDDIVDPGHAEALVREVAQRNDLVDDGDGGNDSFDSRPDTVVDDPGPCGAGDAGTSCYPHRVARFQDRHGRVVLERVLVDRLGHAWAGGRSGHRYADARGPDAGALFWEFFERHALGRDTLRPAEPGRCREWWAPPWWHYMWAGTMQFREYLCDMNPWSMVWRHRIDGSAGPGRCP